MAIFAKSLGFAGQASAPANPTTGNYKTYFKTDGKMYYKNSAGTEVELAAGAITVEDILTSTNTANALSANQGKVLNDGKLNSSMSTNKLLGRATAATGAVEEITLGTGLSFTGTTLNASGSGVTIVNGLTETVAGKVLDATQGKALNDAKANLAGPTFTGTVVLPSTTSIGNVSATELGYVDGVTSAIQTQINAKAPIDSPTFTTIVTAPTNTTYTTRQVRNCVLSTADASGGSNGDIWFKYTP